MSRSPLQHPAGERVGEAGAPSESKARPIKARPRADGALRLVHHHPGYLRAQADAFIDSNEHSPSLRAAKALAEGTPGLRSWSHHPRTGSVVIEYEPGALDADDLLARIARSAGLHGVELAAADKMNREELVSAFLDTVQDINRVVGKATGDRADLRELIPAALVVTSVVSFVFNDRWRGGRMPSWDSALYHAYRIFMNWHRREISAREGAERKREKEARGRDDGAEA